MPVGFAPCNGEYPKNSVTSGIPVLWKFLDFSLSVLISPC